MAERTCAVDGCKGMLLARGWCGTHYSRWRRTGSLSLRSVENVCEHCEASFTSPRAHNRKFCSSRCGSLWYTARSIRISAEKRSRTIKTCPICDRQFSPEKDLKQKYCSKKCLRVATRDTSSKSCSELDCIRPVRARGLCSMHYKRFMRANGAAWESDSEWSDRRRSNYHKRRALKRKLPADDIRPLDVFERDGWVCGICAAPVDRDLQWPDELSASLDHVVPLSRGGHHVLSNVQLAHLGCNVRKGDFLQVDAMSA